MLRLVLVIACFAFVLCISNAQEAEGEMAHDKVKCVNRFVKWCEDMKYPSENGSSGIALMSVSYTDGESHYRVFCSVDSEGTNCTRNRKSWFYCSPQGVLTYDGQNLMEGSATGVNDDICETVRTALKRLDIQNMQINQTVLENAMKNYQQDMENFFHEIMDFQHQMRQLQSRVFDWGPPSSGMYPNAVEGNSDVANATKNSQIEKE